MTCDSCGRAATPDERAGYLCGRPRFDLQRLVVRRSPEALDTRLQQVIEGDVSDIVPPRCLGVLR